MKSTSIVILILSFFIGSIVYGQTPVANFSVDVASGCSPLKVNFTDQSTGNPTEWDWDLGNGTKSTKKSPSGFYIQPGTYQVTLTVKNASGTHVKTNSITVYENPKPAFTVDKRSGCAPLGVSFTDQSQPGSGSVNTTWMWDLGNGAQSTEKNPVIKYQSTGVFTVVLKVTNDKGCSNIITENKYIDVSPGLDLNFSHSLPATCKPPYAIQFTSQSNGGNIKYKWLFGDGKSSDEENPTHSYTTPGVYKVTLIGTNGNCTDSITKTIDLSPIRTDFSINDPLCESNQIGFSNSSSPAPLTSVWKFFDGITLNGINATRTFTNSGTYQVKLINTYGSCKDSVEKSITINKSPVANFKPSNLGNCKPGLAVSFENLSSGAERYEWNFGDGTPVVASAGGIVSHTFNVNGSFLVTLTAINKEGCKSQFTFNKPIVIAPPSVKLRNIPENGCVPLTVSPSFDVQSLTSIADYEWNFGDGTVLKGLNPVHIYTNPGMYTLTLTVTTADGCASSSSQKIEVGSKPVLSFTATPRNACAIDSVTFTNTSQPSSALYTWLFGDGTTSSVYSPKHEYNDTGWFQVKLAVNNNGCIDTISSEREYIYIKAPIARFMAKPNCAISYQYQFVDQSLFDKDSEGRRTWKWEFPDGTVAHTQTPPIYTFPGPGTYPITLTISNGNCMHKSKQLVRIEDKKPDFTFNSNNTCKPVTFTFKAITPATQNVVSYKWEFNGFDTVTTQPELTYLFNTAGNFDLKLTTTDIFGCVNSVTKPVLVTGVKAAFTRSNIEDCKKMTATFRDASESFGQLKINSWKWDFGDGTQLHKSDNASVEHVYAKAGKYIVKLTVRDASGCTDSTTMTDEITILDLRPDFTINDKACLGFPVAYENKSTGQYVSFDWDFGDATKKAYTRTGEHIFKDTGYYDIKLLMTDQLGCKDSLVKKQYVHIAQPVADFKVRDSISYCPPFDVNFTNTSSFFSKVTWKIGDERSNDIDHRKLFTIPGAYKVQLNVVSPDGRCKANTTKTITLYNPEDATLQYDPLQACLPGIVNLKAFNKMSSAKFFWDFGDGNILDTSANETRHIYTDLGSFTPKIILTESSGCILTIAGKVPIQIKGIKTNFDVSTKFFCDSGTLQIQQATSSNEKIVKYSWDFGDGTTSNLQTPIHKYKEPGNYSIRLVAESESGCKDSMQLKAPIKIVASPVISIRGDSIICINETLKHTGILQSRDSSAVKWNWQFPNGKSANVQSPPIQQYTTAGRFQLKTIAVNSSGCADTALQNIIVHPNPLATLPTSITTHVGKPVILPGKYSPNIKTFQWTQEATLSCNNCPQPIASPRFDTKYTVSVIDSNGCKNKADVQVIVLCEGVTVFLPNTFSPNGDGVNDVFYVRGQGLDRVKSLRIFNRWGEVVFEKRDFDVNNAQHGWDGKFKGNKPKPDVYVYQAEVYCANGSLMNFPGNVALIQ